MSRSSSPNELDFACPSTPRLPPELFAFIADALYYSPGAKDRDSKAQAALRSLLLVSTAFYREARRLVFQHIIFDPSDIYDTQRTLDILTFKQPRASLLPLQTFTTHLTLDCSRSVRIRTFRTAPPSNAESRASTILNLTTPYSLTSHPSLFNILCGVILLGHDADKRRGLRFLDILGRNQNSAVIDREYLSWADFRPEISGSLYTLIQSPQLRSIHLSNLKIGPHILYGSAVRRLKLTSVELTEEGTSHTATPPSSCPFPPIDTLEMDGVAEDDPLVFWNMPMAPAALTLSKMVALKDVRSLTFTLSNGPRFGGGGGTPSRLHNVLRASHGLKRLRLICSSYRNPLSRVVLTGDQFPFQLTQLHVEITSRSSRLPSLEYGKPEHFSSFSQDLTPMLAHLHTLTPSSVSDFQFSISLPIPSLPEDPLSSLPQNPSLPSLSPYTSPFSSPQRGSEKRTPPSSPKRTKGPVQRLLTGEGFRDIFKTLAKSLVQLSCQRIAVRVRFVCAACDEKKRKKRDMVEVETKMKEFFQEVRSESSALDLRVTFSCDHDPLNIFKARSL